MKTHDTNTHLSVFEYLDYKTQLKISKHFFKVNVNISFPFTVLVSFVWRFDVYLAMDIVQDISLRATA